MSKRDKIIRDFIVAKQYDAIHDGLSRDEVIKKMEQRAKELGDSIKERFPQVRVDGVSWSGPSIHIPGRTKKIVTKLIEQIQAEFDCVITPHLQ